MEADWGSTGEASSTLLAFHLCMSRFDLAIQVAEQLEDSEVRKLVEEWDTEAQQILGFYILIPRWWQLKYFVFSPRKLGKIPILTNIFQRG